LIEDIKSEEKEDRLNEISVENEFARAEENKFTIDEVMKIQ